MEHQNKTIQKEVIDNKRRFYQVEIEKPRDEYFKWDKKAVELEFTLAQSNPNYLIENGVVPNTPLMRRFAKDIRFCQTQFRDLNDNRALTVFFMRKAGKAAPYIDFGKLRGILRHEYGISTEVEDYFMEYRLADLMWLVNKKTNKHYRERLISQDQQEDAKRHRIFTIFCQNSNAAGFRMESNLAYTNINLIKVEEELYKVFHIILSPMEKLSLDSVQDYIDHIICKMREGGLLYNK